MADNTIDQPANDAAPFFEAQLPPHELEHILNRIEENLTIRQILKKQSLSANPNNLPPTVSFDSLRNRLKEIEALNAPFYRPQLSRGPGKFMRKVLNQVIKIFGYKQRLFNTGLLTLFLDMTVIFQQTLTDQHHTLVATRKEIQQLLEEKQKLETQLDQLVKSANLQSE